MQYYEKLLNSLKRGVISPVYLFFGEEVYLREQMIKEFKKALFPQGGDFNIDILDGETVEPAEVVQMAGTPPFMAERRLVLVKNPPWFSNVRGKGKQPESNMNELYDYLADPLTTTCLIFNVNSAVDRRKKIFKAVEKAGQAVEFSKLKPAELGKWLDIQVRKHGKKIDRSARELLISASTMGLTGLLPEWQKLIAYVGNRREISEEDVKSVVCRSVEYRIFDLMDAVGSRQYAQALNGIRELLANNEKPPLIITMLAWQFRLMLQVKELSKGPLTATQMAGMINEKPFSVKKALKLSQNFSRGQLIDVLTRLAQLDADIKTGRQEFYPGIEALLLSLACQQAR